VVMFALELGVPILAFGPPRARRVAALCMVALQLGLAVIGNYSYFNLLTAVLCVPLLEDADWRRLKLPWPKLEPAPGFAPRHFRPFGLAALALAVVVGALVFGQQFQPQGYPEEVQRAVDRAEAFKVASSYGVFRVMTKTRPEIIIEGSHDGVTWKAYEFPWKPGRVDRVPRFIAPWQPRLDWQMWFAALGSCGNNPWLVSTLRHLLLGTPPVLALFEENPFAGQPPRYVRTTTWQYRFAPGGSNDWWTRAEQGPYCPTVMLDADGQLVRAP
jgi:lipase maturation factor 1